jgi:Reverse transcriptase (RNA-dependent DNA polymerase)
MFKVISGVPQGGHLSPLLFNLFINTVFLNTPSCRILLFADDAKLFARINSINDCDVLQSSLNSFIIWCKAVGLSLNVDKCKIMSFFRSRTFIDYNYHLNGTALKRVYEIKDLGFIYSPSLSFRSHIEYISCKALRILGFIRRHTTQFNSVPCIVTLYCALVRSILDYGSIVWNPSLQIENKLIERVQSRFLSFAGFLLKIDHPQHNYLPVMIKLKLCSLENRRERTDQLFLFNLLHGKIDSSRLLERISLRVPNIHTRSREPFLLPTSRSNFLMNDPLVKAMRSLNNNNFDLWP